MPLACRVCAQGAEDDVAEFMVEHYSECGVRMQGFSDYGAEILRGYTEDAIQEWLG